MIVLDEQLSGRQVREAIAAWYRGAVLTINDLRPDTIIKDDAIPALLHQQRQATFVTINVSDFWQKVPIDRRFCVVCFNIGNNLRPLPSLLRLLFHHANFSSKQRRVGHVFRITVDEQVRYYRYDSQQIQTFRL